MKGIKNRTRLTQVKAMVLHINKQEILVYYDNKEIHTKIYCFWLRCTLNTKSIGKEYLNIIITETFLFRIQ